MKGNKGLRMCVVCHQHKNKSELIRICKDKNNERIVIDKNCSVQSRGFYICNDSNCVEKLLKNKMYVRYVKDSDMAGFENLLKEKHCFK